MKTKSQIRHLPGRRHTEGGRQALLLDSHHPGNFEMTLQYPHRALIAPRVRVPRAQVDRGLNAILV